MRRQPVHTGNDGLIADILSRRNPYPAAAVPHRPIKYIPVCISKLPPHILYPGAIVLAYAAVYHQPHIFVNGGEAAVR